MLGVVAIRILFLADTHLGLDLPIRPRIDRPRRGTDFLENYRRALAPAFEGKVDAVIHGGDLLFRSKVRQELVFLALGPLRELADRGLTVLLVPGNHERSAIPFPLLAAHPNIHLFSRPRTFHLEAEGICLAIAGFPNVRDSIQRDFAQLVAETEWDSYPSDARILCIHQAVEGATVGPSGYVFRRGADIVPGRLIPKGFLAVLSGHIHRAQILLRDLSGRRLEAPVLYPGSIERTSFAERDESKGYFTLEISGGSGRPGQLRNVEFHELPARPMVRLTLPDSHNWESWLSQKLAQIPRNSFVQIRTTGNQPVPAGLSAAEVRRIAPAEMITDLRPG